jgi:hypothetical protein
VPEEYRYRGRNIGRSEILFVRQFIAEHPEMSRYALSRRLCELWQWKQANGALRDMLHWLGRRSSQAQSASPGI